MSHDRGVWYDCGAGNNLGDGAMAMRSLTADGERRLGEIAGRYGISQDAARSMLVAVTNGGGSMAQFSHPELGGSGQWMRGGMTMVGDMFNNGLKATVDNLCNDLANLLLNPPPGLWRDDEPSFGGGFGGGNWWPEYLGSPNASGAQNDLRYAYFGGSARLAIEIGGRLTIYDTADHRISGVSQQQGNGWTLTFTSQYGTVPLSALRVEDGDARPAAPVPDVVIPDAPSAPAPVEAPPVAPESLAGSVWSFGPWGGDATATLTFGGDGTVTGSGDARQRYWSVEDGSLTLYDTDGRATACFPLPAAGTTDPVWRGQDPHRSEQSYALRAPGAPPREPEPPRAAADLPLDLTVGDWVLEDVNGNRLCGLRLLPDGRVEGGRPGEASWRVADHSLVLLHGSGRPTSRFEIIQFRAGHWTLIGAPLNNSAVSLFLKQA